MAKKPKGTTSYTLAFGYPTAFRRTVQSGDARVQLVFEPGEHYELTDEEAEGIQKELSVGLIVPSDFDPKGRQKRPTPISTDANSVIAKLEAKVESLAAENAQLKADLEAATKPTE